MQRSRLYSLVAALAAGAAVALTFAVFTTATPAGDQATKNGDAKAVETKAVETKPSADASKDKAKQSTAKDVKKADAKKTDAKSADAAKADAKKLADMAAKAKAEKIEPAENSYCIVCHLNYETEKLSLSHQIVGVGCAKCHGESEKHSGDEDGLTAPDVIFAHEEVDKFCMTCHPKEKIEKNENHKEVFDAKIPADEHLVCTECHGENHKMAHRTRKWDPKTRKLISDDGVRMMYKDSPATEGVPEAKTKPAK